MTGARIRGQTLIIKRLDAHAIANRILRKENYLIALFNKDILDLSFPLLGSQPLLTRIVEWSLSYCVLSFAFDEKGQVKRRFLKEANRCVLSTKKTHTPSGRLVLGQVLHHQTHSIQA